MEEVKTLPYYEDNREEIVENLNKKEYHLINPDEITSAHYDNDNGELYFEYSGCVHSDDFKGLILDMIESKLERTENKKALKMWLTEQIKHM